MTELYASDMPKVLLPVFPFKNYYITDFGAVPGGEDKNTSAIQNAIDTASREGGGHVIVPSGIWLTGPIRLRSGVDLHLEAGSFLNFTHDKDDFEMVRTWYEGIIRMRAESPIHAFQAENIAITGQGIVDGNGHLWNHQNRGKLIFRKPLDPSVPRPRHIEIDPCDYDADVRAKEEQFDFCRPVMVNLVRCRKVLLEGVTFQNSPAWNLHPLFCENITVRNCEVRNAWFCPNGDGIDLESCRFAEIHHVKFDVGDDGICIKAGKNAMGRSINIPTEHVYVHDCVVYHGHGGITVGSEMSRGVRDMLVENCTFIGTDTGIRFKSTLGRGGVVENICIKNIRMISIPKEAIIFTMAYGGAIDEDRLTDRDIPEFKEVYMKDIVCASAERALRIDGLDLMPIHDLTFENVSITAKGGVYIDKAANIRFINTVIESEDGAHKLSFADETINGAYRAQFRDDEVFKMPKPRPFDPEAPRPYDGSYPHRSYGKPEGELLRRVGV